MRSILEMHIYGNGGHGGGLTARGGIPFGTWTDRYVDWFKDLGFLGKPGQPTKAAVDAAAFDRKTARGAGVRGRVCRMNEPSPGRRGAIISRAPAGAVRG